MKLLLVSGLTVTLLLILRQPFSPIAKGVIILTKYRSLLPYIVAQARHETKNFTSPLYKKYSNMFGMKHPTKRLTVGVSGPVSPEGNSYQSYPLGEVQSVVDYILWLEATKFPTMVKDLTAFVDALATRGYFGDSIDNYYNGLKRWMK